MKVKDQKTNKFFTIEELAQRLNTDSPIFAGVKAFKGWLPGKRVSEKDFNEAVNGFLGTPQGGKK